MAVFDKIWLGNTDPQGKYVPDVTVTQPKLKRINDAGELDGTVINGTNNNDGSYSFTNIPNGKWLFYDNTSLKSNIYGAPENGGKVYFDGTIDGTYIKVADGTITTAKLSDGAVTTVKLGAASVTPAKMASQIKTLSSLSDTADYYGQTGRFNGENYIAKSGGGWDKISGSLPLNDFVLSAQNEKLIKKFMNTVFAGYNNDNSTFYGFGGSTASIIPNDETCLFTKGQIRNMHRFSVPSGSASGSVQQASADINNNGNNGTFGAWFRKSSLQSFVSNQGIKFSVYQIGGSTKTNDVIITGASLYTVGYVQQTNNNGYVVTVKVLAERGGWIYITVSYDLALGGYGQTRLLMTWVNSLNGSGFNMDIINPTFLFNTDYVDPSIIYPENETQAAFMDTTLGKINEIVTGDRDIPNRALSVCLAGTSITDQTHFLVSESDYFTSVVAEYIFTVLADTVTYNQPVYSGSRTVVYNPKMFKNAGYKLTGAGSYVEFELYGDELMLIQAIERAETGAAIINMYVDGILYDSFSNYNLRPKGTGATASWTGNGTQRKFSLGRNFCYSPRSLTVNGSSKTVKHNTFSPPVDYSTFDGSDALLIRKYEAAGGETVVNNYLWFKTAPSNGHVINLTYDYGENITWTKSTLGEISAALTQISILSGGNLESYEGDGNTDVDSSTITQESLDFRYSNPEACKIWKFSQKKKRTFKFVISGLDPRGSGTPYFIFNAATNKAHRLMNAGIHGYTARELAGNNPANDLRTYYQIQAFKPDLVLIEHGANDDNLRVYNFPIAVKQQTTVAESVIRNFPTRFIKTLVYNGTDDYTLTSAFLSISAITNTTVTLAASGVTYDSTPAAGDVIRIGTHHNSNKEFVCRVISSWNNSTKTAAFKDPLSVTEFIGINSLNDLTGAQAVIYRLDNFESALNTIVDGLRDANPDVQIALCTSGMPNAWTQDLDSYAAKTRAVASAKGTNFGSNYQAIKNFTYSQPCDTQAYLTSANNTTSNGSSSYTLVTGAGANPQASYQFFNWSVKVDGVERYGDGTCYIEGGKKGTFAAATSASSLTTSDWEDAKNKMSNESVATKLYFSSNVPSNGSTVIVKYSYTKVSYDDSHPDTVNGFRVYASVLIGAIKKMLYSLKLS